MLNITLTITAAPELLAAISNFTNAVAASKGTAVAENNLDFSKEQKAFQYEMQQPSVFQENKAQGGIPAQQQAPLQVPPTTMSMYNENPVPTADQSYTLEQLAVAATSIVDAGRRTDLVGLLSSFGIQALTSLPKEQYGAFATELRSLGAKI